MASILFALAVGTGGCGNNATFGGGAGQSAKDPVKKNGDALPELPAPPAPVQPTAPENPLQSAEVSVSAKTVVGAAFYKTGVKESSIALNAATLPAGYHFDPQTGQFRFQTDLQDIGKPFRFPFSATFEGSDFSAEASLVVTAPVTTKNSCSYRPDPVIGTLAPVEKWHWTGWNPGGDVLRHYITYSSPAVADLDGDGSIEVLSIPSTSNYSSVNGPLVVLEGKTGLPKWNSIEAINQGAAVSTTPAIIDLDADGFAEIIFTAFVTGSSSAKEILAVDYRTKTVKWRFATGFICPTACIPAVADIDGDGIPEVAAGNVILKHDGTLKATLTPAPGVGVPSTVSIADVDPAVPGLELVVNGNQVYRADGTRLWDGGCRGYSAVADLDRDNSQEVVCVGGGKVVVNAKDGTPRWTADIPMNPALPAATTSGGAPNIGNFAGSEDFEIGTAGGDYYVVFDKNGTELWKQQTTDRSSHRTGSTIFDFNGDGKVEVTYNDEQKLRIYDGATGTILWETENRSGTLWEYPVVANIDDDASVEIIVSAPNRGGVRVFDDPSNLWVTSRRLWNQYSYYPEIVTDNLRAVATPGTPRSGFRINTQGAVLSQNEIQLSDLTAVTPLFPDEEVTNAAGTQTLTFYIVNQGQGISADQINVELLDYTQAILGTTRIVSAIEAGAGTLIKLTTPNLTDRIHQDMHLKLNFDSGDTLLARECQSQNNTVTFRLNGMKRVTAAP